MSHAFGLPSSSPILHKKICLLGWGVATCLMLLTFTDTYGPFYSLVQISFFISAAYVALGERNIFNATVREKVVRSYKGLMAFGLTVSLPFLNFSSDISYVALMTLSILALPILIAIVRFSSYTHIVLAWLTRSPNQKTLETYIQHQLASELLKAGEPLVDVRIELNHRGYCFNLVPVTTYDNPFLKWTPSQHIIIDAVCASIMDTMIARPFPMEWFKTTRNEDPLEDLQLEQRIDKDPTLYTVVKPDMSAHLQISLLKRPSLLS
jgi:hypothetical protein